MQLHQIKVNIEIRQVKLNVRFPGQLSFQFKNTQIYQDMNSKYPIVNGVSKVQDQVNFNMETTYSTSTKKYAAVNVDLVMSINTSSGKIVAGSVSFDAVQNISIVLPLKRCSDKAASIDMKVSFEKVKKIRDIEGEIKQEKNVSPQKDLTPLTMRKERVFQRIKQRQRQVSRSNSKSHSKGRGHLPDSRIKDIEQKYDRRVRMLKDEKNDLEDQLDRARQKWRLCERRQKELLNAIKELKQGNQKKRLKFSEMEVKQIEYQRQTTEMERKYKQVQQQLKENKQQNESLQSKIHSLEKKVEIRQQASSERDKRQTDKIHNMQNQSSKIMKDYNALLQKMEISQKANQNNIKQKQKGFYDEKSKLKEQIDSLQRDKEKYKTLFQDIQNRSSSLNQHQRSLMTKFSELEMEHQRSLSTIASQKTQIDRLKYSKQQFQNDLKEHQSGEHEKINLRKKLNDQAQQTQKVQDKLSKLILDYQEIKQNLLVSENQNEQSRKQRKVNLSKINQMEKLNLSNERQISRLQSQNNTLSSKNTYLNQRINDVKTKLQQKEEEFQDNQTNYTAKINSIMQSKQYLENEIEDLRWTLQKEKQNIEQRQSMVKNKNSQLLSQQETSLKLQKQVDHYKRKIQEIQAQVSSLKNEINDFKKKDLQNAELVKQKQRNIYNQNKKISQIEQEYFLNMSKLKNASDEKDEIIENVKKQLTEVNKQLEDNVDKLNILTKQKEELSDNYHELQRINKLQKVTLQESDKQMKQFDQVNRDLKMQVKRLKKIVDDIQNEANSSQQEYVQRNTALKKQLQQAQKTLKLKQTDIESYENALKQLLLILSSEQEHREDIIAVPDSNLAKIQIQAIMARNKNINKAHEKVLQLQVEIGYLEKQNQNKIKIIQEKQQKLEIIYSQNNLKVQSLEESWKTEKEEFLKKLQMIQLELEESRTQKDKLQTKLKGVNQLYQDQQLSRQKRQQELEKARQIIKQNQEKLLNIRENQINSKSEGDSLLDSLKNQMNQQIEVYQQKLKLISKEKEKVDKNLNEKEKQVSSLKGQLSKMKIKKQKFEQSLAEQKADNEKKSQQISNLQQNLQDKKAQVVSLMQEVVKVESELKNQEQLKLAIQTKLRQARQQLSQVSIAKEGLMNQLKTIQNSSSSTNEELRSKIILLEENLELETKKSKQYFDKNTLANNEIELKSFEIGQIKEKLKEKEVQVISLSNNIEEKKIVIVKNESEIADLTESLMKSEKQKLQFSDQKVTIEEQLQVKKYKLLQQEGVIASLTTKIDDLKHELQQISEKYENVDQQRSNVIIQSSEVKEALTQTKKELQQSIIKIAQLKSKLGIVEHQLKEKEQFYQNYKNKNWDQNQKTVHSLKQKCSELEHLLKTSENNREIQMEELKNELEEAYKEKEELQLMLDDREDLIQNQQDEIIASQNRILSLNSELKNCLQAWEKEKTAALPSRRQAHKIQEDLTRFQQYASELEKKAKDALRGVGSKSKDEVMAKIGQQLVDLLDIQNRAKLRILNFVVGQQRVAVLKEFESMREKIQDLLKSQKGILSTNDAR